MRGLTSMKIELAAIDIEQELDGAGAAIADRSAQPRRRVADALRAGLGQIDARRDFDDLLVPPLDRAVALPEMHQVAVRVAENLHFDVLGARRCSARGRHPAARTPRRLRAAPPSSLRVELVRALHDPHAAAAAAEARLDHQRVADACCAAAATSSRRSVERLLGAGNRRNAGRLRQPLRRGLVAEHVEVLGRRADERGCRPSSQARASAALSARNP